MKFKWACSKAWFLGCAMLILFWPGTLSAEQPGKNSAQPKNDKKPPANEKLDTITYDVSDIVAKRSLRDFGTTFEQPAMVVRGNGQPMNMMDELTRSILEQVPKLAQNCLGKTPLHNIHVLNGKKLEIHTNKKTHEQIQDLLAAFRRLQDVALEVKCWLFELDKDVFDKKIAGKMIRPPGTPGVFLLPGPEDPETEEETKPLADADKPFRDLKPLKTTSINMQDREQIEIFSWKTIIPYERNPHHVFVKKEIALALPGFSVSLTPVIGPDRRKTQIRLTQQVTQLQAWKKTRALELQPNQHLKEVFFEVPVLQESSITSTFKALDGQPVIVPVQWQRPGAKASLQLVLVFTPIIRIEEEERALQKQREEEKNKKK